MADHPTPPASLRRRHRSSSPHRSPVPADERLSTISPLRIILIVLQFMAIESLKMAANFLLEPEAPRQEVVVSSSDQAWRRTDSSSDSSDPLRMDSRSEDESAPSAVISHVVLNLDSQMAVRHVQQDLHLFQQVKTLHLSIESQSSHEWWRLRALLRSLGSLPALEEITFSNRNGGAMFLPVAALNELLRDSSAPLKSLSFEHCYFVHTDNDTDMDNDDQEWDGLLSQQPLLEELVIRKCWKQSANDTLDYLNYGRLLQRLAANNATLRHLTIDCWRSPDDVTSDQVQPLLQQCTQLQSLTLQGFTIADQVFVDMAPFIQQHAHLRTLVLGNVNLVDEAASNALIQVLQHNTSLQSLELHPQFETPPAVPTTTVAAEDNAPQQQQPQPHDHNTNTNINAPLHHFLAHTIPQGLQHNRHLQHLHLALPRALLQQPLTARTIPTHVQQAWVALVRNNLALQQLSIMDGTVFYENEELQSALQHFLLLNRLGRNRLAQQFEQVPQQEWVSVLEQAMMCHQDDEDDEEEEDVDHSGRVSRLYDLMQMNPAMMMILS